MSGITTETPFDLTDAVRKLVTEDDEPVDNIFSEKQRPLPALDRRGPVTRRRPNW